MLLVLLVSAFSLLALGFVVHSVRNALRDPNTSIDKKVSDPILLDDWVLPKK